ncbi:uncharacterized protein EV420DRAFT_1636673 [Desarmillaria tabescens]|uniref:Uncharacterized protein n=1 Tax=Armillaria tabescens TaxID=1929756 RepID=A0AA39NI44_ARMTA|nr:uncharacterized protein EV420DRAFT_1636673 [Desarmillaria tabescens]KAK0466068.1 hypothetical protein EV420DRAFT_1636673 [Desarmillaria tabescens]
MVVPHFGDYIAFKLDPVASLCSLKDPEVTKFCEALMTKVYVACVTHLFSFPLPGVEYISVSMTLVSQGLSDGQPDRLILPDMAVPILPNTSNPLSRPPLNPTLPLPWPDCYSPYPDYDALVVFETTFTIGDPWPDPKYQLRHQERLLEIYHFEDVARRDALQKEQEALRVGDGAGDVDGDQPDQLHESMESSGTPIVLTRPFKLTSFLRSLLGKVLRWVPCVHTDLDYYDRDFSDDPLHGFDLFGATPPDTMPVIELDALESIEADYHKRMEIKVQADIEGAREKDEVLHAQLQSKMPKREPSPVETVAVSASVTEVIADAKSSANA